MKWRMFFVPVKSLNADEARACINKRPASEITVLDVRQPGEYEYGHIPGAKLIPLPELNSRLTELDPEKATLVYCAVGGRSRVAAQMLSGKGFKEVYNLKGGINVWTGHEAEGTEELGLDLFEGDESIEDALMVAYSLEEGLREFYVAMKSKVDDTQAKGLFQKLSEIEDKHKARVLAEYVKITGEDIGLEQFESKLTGGIMEGGLTTDEYYQFFKSGWETVEGIIEAAMGIEAQALDLYTRASDKTDNPDIRQALIRLSDEEQAHLARLGQLMDSIYAEGR
jgi:rhodanese-related sulfurtransferase/rubrerythrin